MGGALFGVDVSLFQGTVDWARVKASGVTFAVARCVRETGTVDVTYRRNVDGARKAGLVPGAYAFLVGGMAHSQAKTFIAAVGNPKGMLIMLDVERPQMKGHPVPTAADIAAFVGEWRAAHPDHPILIYGSMGSILGSIARKANLHQFGPLWLAWYRTGQNHTPPAFYDSIGGNHANQWRQTFGGWAGPTIWQFTSHGIHVPGIQKPGGAFRAVDTNAFRGTRAQLLALAGGGAAVPALPPSGTPAHVDAGPAVPGHHAHVPVPHAPAQPAPHPTHAPPSPARKKVFHVVKPGENLSVIAKRFGFKGFRALIALFPENHKFKAHPGLIHPGDRVRVA